ncbi:MAG: prepilin-type N-terminal cleavage/methylation domain-containing protein [Phycisphaerales bacterium]
MEHQRPWCHQACGPHLAGRRRFRAAFTLIELVMVVVIVGVVAAIAIPRFANASSRYRVDLAAARVASDIELTRDTARSVSASMTVRFVEGSARFGSVASNPGALNIGPTTPKPGFVSNISGEPYFAYVAAAKFGTGPQLDITPYGAFDSDGLVIVTNGTWGGAISVDSKTGTITRTIFIWPAVLANPEGDTPSDVAALLPESKPRNRTLDTAPDTDLDAVAGNNVRVSK